MNLLLYLGFRFIYLVYFIKEGQLGCILEDRLLMARNLVSLLVTDYLKTLSSPEGEVNLVTWCLGIENRF